jgi:hypothetical protein
MRVHYFQTGKVRTLKRRIARTWEKVAGKVVGKCLPLLLWERVLYV